MGHGIPYVVKKKGHDSSTWAEIGCMQGPRTDQLCALLTNTEPGRREGSSAKIGLASPDQLTCRDTGLKRFMMIARCPEEPALHERHALFSTV
jgi:hypothetical protein